MILLSIYLIINSFICGYYASSEDVASKESFELLYECIFILFVFIFGILLILGSYMYDLIKRK